VGLNKHKALQQFFRWLVEEAEIERSPMLGVSQPQTAQKLVEVLGDEEAKRILEAYRGNDFMQMRDQALVRMFYNTGGRLSEIGDMLVPDVDLNTDSAVLTGKGGKECRVRSERRRHVHCGGICARAAGVPASTASSSCGSRSGVPGR
jgi:integrase/recombinase XerC